MITTKTQAIREIRAIKLKLAEINDFIKEKFDGNEDDFADSFYYQALYDTQEGLDDLKFHLEDGLKLK